MINIEEKQIEQSVENCSITPNTGKLLQIVVPALGHDMVSAFLDLLDNCYDADASKMKVVVNSNNGQGESIDSYFIIDNGCGMNRETLIESFRFATEMGHNEGDLGKFGIGGTVSIFTLGEKTIKLSKQKNGPLLVGELDISEENSEQLRRNDPLRLREPSPMEREFFEKHCGNHGTIIIIEKPRKKEYTNSRHLSNRLVKELGNSFYQRINKKCSIYVDVPNASRPDMRSRLVKSKDPLFGDLMVGQDMVKSSYTEDLEYEGSLIRLRFTEINRSTTSDEDRSMSDQGIYWNRNNRLIASGCSHKVLWRKHNSGNCGRVEVSFSEDLDKEFSVGALKNGVIPIQPIVDLLKPSIRKFELQVKRTAKEAPLPENVKELEKEDDNFTRQLKINAASIGLPKGTTPGSGKVIEINNPGKGGRGPDRQPRSSRSLLTPEFDYVTEPRTPRPWWHNWEEGQMVITINVGHKFIKDNFTTDNQKLTIRKIVAAESLAAYDLSIYDEDANSNINENINTFLEKVSEKLNAIDKSVK